MIKEFATKLKRDKNLLILKYRLVYILNSIYGTKQSLLSIAMCFLVKLMNQAKNKSIRSRDEEKRHSRFMDTLVRDYNIVTSETEMVLVLESYISVKLSIIS